MNIRNIKNKINNKSYLKLFENFFSLSVLNIANYLFPLILIPYLTGKLGVEKYGLYAFGFAIINYFTLIVNYGFDFSATKQVAINRDNQNDLYRIFSAVLSVRILLIFFSAILLFALITLIPRFRGEKEMLLSGLGIFAGIGLMPLWLFQGLEKMKLVTITAVLSRLLSTVLILAFVNEADDYRLAISFQSLGYLTGGLFSIVLAVKMLKIKFILPKIADMITQLKEGLHIFLSTVGMNFYRESNTIILGFVTNFTIVGYYAAAEKIIKAIQSFTSPIVNTLYPYFGRQLNVGEDTTRTYRRFKKLGIYYSFLLIGITLFVVLLSPWIIRNYLGISYIATIPDIQIMSLVLIFGSLNYYYGIIGLVNMGEEKLFARAVWISGIVSLVICFILSKLFMDKGAAVSMSMAEVLLFVLILVFLRKSDHNPKYSILNRISEPVE